MKKFNLNSEKQKVGSRAHLVASSPHQKPIGRFNLHSNLPNFSHSKSKQSYQQNTISNFFSSIVGNTNTLNLRVKIESANGLLVWTGGDEMSPASDFLLLGIENGFLHFRFSIPRSKKSEAGLISSPPVHTKSPLADSIFTRRFKVFVLPTMLDGKI